jgi:hypothetical protein
MIIFDPTKEIPEPVRVLDMKKKAAKKRYEARYRLEDEYRVKSKA